ncbi:MAG: hypothetical protein ACOYS2_01475 [Patescibacteria group bacterium]
MVALKIRLKKAPSPPAEAENPRFAKDDGLRGGTLYKGLKLKPPKPGREFA